MTSRQWAEKIVDTLQREGHVALFAGGCVRDAILGIEPKDYDVATSATPDEVQQVFGEKKTLAVGKSFGVITVIGSRSCGHIEVATFRRDGGYSDGRRPDSVEFTNAQEDALRRDFTINGIFFDPVAEQVIDYVGGKMDIENKLVRAIGDADQRIEEDKLRMMRGVRFAATYGFELERATKSAIRKSASEIKAVSPERIGTELRRMIGHRASATALRLLIETGLWPEIFPGYTEQPTHDWNLNVQVLSDLHSDFATNLAAALYQTSSIAADLQDTWRLKNDEVARADWILDRVSTLAKAAQLPWSQLQPMLMSPHAEFAIQFLAAVAATKPPCQLTLDSIEHCRKKLNLPAEELDPAPLIDGRVLKALGVTPGPMFREILDQVRKGQLDGTIEDYDSAVQWAKRYIRSEPA